jgi:hypothetical protein
MVESTFDLHSGASGLFRFHYMLVPAQNSSGPAFCAVRMASIEELAPHSAPMLRNGGIGKQAAPPAAVVAAVESLLGKVPEEPNKVCPHSSRVHETIEMLIGEARPPPKPAAATVGTGGASGGGSGQGGATAVAAVPAPAAGAARATPQGGRGVGNGGAPQVAAIRAGRAKGGIAAAAAPPAAAAKRRR